MSNRKLYVELNKERDGESKRMACHKVVYVRQPYSTSTPTTSRSTMEPDQFQDQFQDQFVRLAISTTETLTDLKTDLVVANNNNNYGTRSFIYADDLCITAQYQSFKQVEKTIEEALDNLTIYYKVNSVRANPEKTQVTAFHLRNKDAKRSLKVV